METRPPSTAILIRRFDFTELDGKEKWTAYRFTKNVYDIWMPTHLKRIYLVIDDLPPDLDFDTDTYSTLEYLNVYGVRSIFTHNYGVTTLSHRARGD